MSAKGLLVVGWTWIAGWCEKQKMGNLRLRNGAVV